MEPWLTGSARLLGADDSLAALLRDVFGEVGITLCTGEERSSRPDLVLVLVQRGDSILGALQSARDGTYPAPVFVLVPFADERMMQLALRLGARGCFALGQPLEELRRMVLAVVPRARRERTVSTGKSQEPESRKER